MNYDQLSFLNPNYFHGCHPLDLRSYFESDPFFEKLDSAFPLNLAKTAAPASKPTYRQQVLKRLLENLSTQMQLKKNSHSRKARWLSGEKMGEVQ